MEFIKLEDEIKYILKNNEQARADDMKLWLDYAHRHLSESHTPPNDWIARIMVNDRYRIMNDIYTYEAVSRVRRKIQAEHEELRPSKDVIEARKKMVKEYKAYARNHRENRQGDICS